MIKNYNIAGKELRINTDFDFCQDEFSKQFESNQSEFDTEIKIILGNTNTDYLFDFENELYKEFVNNKKIIRSYYVTQSDIPHFIFKSDGKNSEGILNKNAGTESRNIYHFWGFIDLPGLMIRQGCIILHSSYIIYNGKAVLFCGKKEIGKSTQAALWEKYAGAETINGDKAIVFFKNGKAFASSLPICGTSKICKNKTAELNAVVFLEKDKENTVVNMSPSHRLVNLLANSLHNPRIKFETDAAAEICAKIVSSTNVFQFNCTPDENAVITLRKVLE